MTRSVSRYLRSPALRGFFLLPGTPVRELWDVIVIGGGPAGLSAALTLGRCRRTVLVCDAGQVRNRHAHRMHCFLTRDGTPPAEFLALAREQLRPYTTVEVRQGLAIDVARLESGFEVLLLDGSRERCRKLLIATGVVDHLPDVPGVEAYYGTSVHHCPYCDGWEWRDQPLGIYGRGEKGVGLALMLHQWSADLVLFTDGDTELSAQQHARLARAGIAIQQARIAGLEGDAGQLEAVRLSDGRRIARRALFFNTGQHQRSALARRLGSRLTAKGGVEVGAYEESTGVPGLYIAGDAVREVQLVVVAAAEGVKAAFAINHELTPGLD